MRYLGGKNRTAKRIAAYLESVRQPEQLFVEPFVGGAWVTAQMRGPRLCFDANKYLIALYRALQQGWQPPTQVSEAEYAIAKTGAVPDHLRAFIGIGCSWGGKWFGGYARDKSGSNYAAVTARSLAKVLPLLQDVVFAHLEYKTARVSGCLIYCDPPYAHTTGFDGVGDFDSIEFWGHMREWSRDNIVIVSEYAAPDDFGCILSMDTSTSLHMADGQNESRIERLFRLHAP